MLDASRIKADLERLMTMPVELVTIVSQTEIRVHLKPLLNTVGAVMTIVRREQYTPYAYGEWKRHEGDLAYFVAYALNT